MRKHPHKDIQRAIDHAIECGWIRGETGSSAHAFCKLKCAIPEHSEHMLSIWTTPKNPEHFARQIIRAVNKCRHLSS